MLQLREDDEPAQNSLIAHFSSLIDFRPKINLILRERNIPSNPLSCKNNEQLMDNDLYLAHFGARALPSSRFARRDQAAAVDELFRHEIESQPPSVVNFIQPVRRSVNSPPEIKFN